MLDKINRLKNWQVLIIFVFIGFAVFGHSLNNPFWGDDIPQIVNNVPVHSISNIKLFFEGSTFYDGQGNSKLTGTYYRPLMTTTFSLIYSAFGAHSFYYHLLQLLLCIGNSIILYLILKNFFKPIISLPLAIVFLLHPINSQVVYSIPCMQDALFVFFGLAALYTLIKFKNKSYLIVSVLLLMLSLLSKESGVLFVAVSLIYLLRWDRKRLVTFVAILAIPIAAYIYLHINAVGIASNPKNAPIDNLSLQGRLINAPSIILFYITKILFPLKLAYGYFWVYSTITIRHFFLPLAIDGLVLAAIVYLGMKIRKVTPKLNYFIFLFFAIWIVIGFVLIMQLVPLDFTVSEAWFYFTSIGILGILGSVASTFRPKLEYRAAIMIGVIIIITLLGVRSFVRGFDWRSQDTLANAEINADADDYTAYNLVAQNKLNQGDTVGAKTSILKSIDIYPLWSNYNTLGNILAKEHDYDGAYSTYKKGLQYGQNNIIYENLCQLTLVRGDPAENEKFLVDSLKKYPADSNIWLYFALFEQSYKNNKLAKAAISQSAIYAQVPSQIYYSIINNQPFSVNLSGLNKTISF